VSILVIDVGTSSVRAALVYPDGTVRGAKRKPLPPDIPMPGLVEFDPTALAAAAIEAADAVITEAKEPIEAVGVTTQRASTVAWDAVTGKPFGAGLGWQDLRTVGTCLELQAEGMRFSPSESATKYAWHASQLEPDSRDQLKLGTVDSWIVWNLTGGASHVTDATNAGVTGLYSISEASWRTDALDRLGLDPNWLPSIVDSTGPVAAATALPGDPLICSLVGDQQASLVGQGCTRPGLAKATFGTGAMLDICLGDRRPQRGERTSHGCFPILAWQQAGAVTWGAEAIMLTAGTAVDWLVEDLQLISSAQESEQVAAETEHTDGVVMVPALLGLGTPQWDFGARGALFGITRGTKRSHVVRAVLEGVAHSGADLLEAIESDTGLEVPALRIDGGMSANRVFVQALADACCRPIEVSKEREATTLGAGYLAGLAIGTWSSTEDIATAWAPKVVVEPSGRPDGRELWQRAVERAGRWYPELSEISF
jgi:glycerol kinase